MSEEQRASLKRMLREDDSQYFTDIELEAYFKECNDNLNATAYKCLIIKAQDSTLSVSGLSSGDTSKYYLRLAKFYKPNNSGILRSVY